MFVISEIKTSKFQNNRGIFWNYQGKECKGKVTLCLINSHIIEAYWGGGGWKCNSLTWSLNPYYSVMNYGTFSFIKGSAALCWAMANISVS
jgi:hypothetical protein